MILKLKNPLTRTYIKLDTMNTGSLFYIADTLELALSQRQVYLYCGTHNSILRPEFIAYDSLVKNITVFNIITKKKKILPNITIVYRCYIDLDIYD